jgi:hypothetical protein
MLLTVGYAALNDLLTIDANLGATKGAAEEEFDGDIYFSNKVINKDDTNKATCVITGGDTATITATDFTKKGQQVIVLLTVTNDSTEFDGKLTVKSNALTSEHSGVFSATCEWYDNGAGTGNLNEKVIAGNGGTALLLVTLTLNETPVDAHTATYKVEFDVESLDMATNP